MLLISCTAVVYESDSMTGCLTFFVDWVLCCCYSSLPYTYGGVDGSKSVNVALNGPTHLT